MIFRKMEIYYMILRKIIFDDNSWIIALIYNSIGEVYNHLKQYELALKFHREAFEIRNALFGKNHEDTLDSHKKIILTN